MTSINNNTETDTIFTLNNLPKYNKNEWLKFIIKHKNYNFIATYDTGSMHVWSDTGAELVCIYDIKDIFPKNVNIMHELENILDKYTDGYAICSICRKPMPRSEVALDFFAGRYCKECVTPELEKEREWAYSHLE